MGAYEWETPAMCRKANLDFLEHKEMVGQRKLTVFFGCRIVDAGNKNSDKY